MNKDYINNNLKKNPYIKKNLLKMEDIDSINIEYIKHFIKIINQKPPELDLIQISYSNYKSFFKLYRAILKIVEEDPISFKLEDLSIEEKEKYLKTHSIDFIKENDVITIVSKDYETTKLLGSSKWCISKSKNMWKEYNSNATHLIIYKEDEIVGVSIKKGGVKAFNKKDGVVGVSKVKNILPENYKNLINKETTEISIPETIYTILCSVIILYAGNSYLYYGLNLIIKSPNIIDANALAMSTFTSQIVAGVMCLLLNRSWLGVCCGLYVTAHGIMWLKIPEKQFNVLILGSEEIMFKAFGI